MNLGVASTADAEIRARFAELADELDRVLVIPMRTVGIFKFRGDITAQSHNVLDPHRLHIRNSLADGLAGRGNTGKVSQSRYAVVCLDIFCNVEGVFARAAARAISDAHKGRTELCDLLCSVLHALKSRVGLRRKDLE